MLRSRRMRSSRAPASVLPLVPKSRSKTARGSFSQGSGVVGVRHASVFVKAQLAPSHAPRTRTESRASSSEANCVSAPKCWAAT